MTTWASPFRDNGGRGCVPREATRAWTAVAHLRRAWMQQPRTTLQTRLPKGRREKTPRRQRSAGQLLSFEGAIRSDRGIVLCRLLASPSRRPRWRARTGASTVGRKSGRRPSRFGASSSCRARAGELRGREGSRLAGSVDVCFDRAGCIAGAGVRCHGAWPEGKDGRNE